MNQLVSIVMYHYVRDLKNSRYPEIKGLSIELFNEQISYIQKHYHVISAYDLMDAVQYGHDLPPNPLLLTFDDGYSDHFSNVFPELDKKKLPGCFFPTRKVHPEAAGVGCQQDSFHPCQCFRKNDSGGGDQPVRGRRPVDV